MTNTTVTITYSDGSERTFTASDELEAMINEGKMFSVTTMRSDIALQEEVDLSKMYVGNPMVVLGNLLTMQQNAVKTLDPLMEEGLNGEKVQHPVTQCIQGIMAMLKEEIVSMQSNMTSANGEAVTPSQEATH